MGIWLTKVRAKTHGGKIVTSEHRFKQKAEIGQFLNRIMDTGKYVSCGASTKWAEKPIPPRDPNGTLESIDNRKPTKPEAVCTIREGSCTIHCNTACGVGRFAGRSPQADPETVQQAQSLHNFCKHGVKHGKCYKCRINVLRGVESVVDDEEHRCC